MSDIQDCWSCLKNLIRMMCIDGVIAEREKKFLFHAARELDLSVPDWEMLIEEVEQDSNPIFPIRSKTRGIAALQAMMLMAKMDKHVDEREKDYLRKFAKSIGVTREQWQSILRDTNLSDLFEPFQKSLGRILILREDFEQFEALVETAKQTDIPTGYGIYCVCAIPSDRRGCNLLSRFSKSLRDSGKMQNPPGEDPKENYWNPDTLSGLPSPLPAGSGNPQMHRRTGLPTRSGDDFF